jgi:hypothetical protein
MTYTIQTPCPYREGRFDTKIDLPRFVADLARELGGELLPAPGEYPNERQQIKIGADVLTFGTDWQARTVTTYISAPDVPHDDRNFYDKTHKAAEASVRPDARPIAAIARDIKRRVIDASQNALALQRAYAVERARGRSNLLVDVEAFRRAFPAADVRVNERDRRATIYGGAQMHYVNATINGDSMVTIERLGSMNLATFERLMTLLNEHNPPEVE